MIRLENELPYRRILKEHLLPYFMSIGVSPVLFWDSAPIDLKPYETAEDMRIERQNRMMWLQGRYFADAIAACFSEHKYPDEPIRITEMTELEKQEKVRKAREDVVRFFSAMIPKETNENE